MNCDTDSCLQDQSQLSLWAVHVHSIALNHVHNACLDQPAKEHAIKHNIVT